MPTTKPEPLECPECEEGKVIVEVLKFDHLARTWVRHEEKALCLTCNGTQRVRCNCGNVAIKSIEGDPYCEKCAAEFEVEAA